jgi:two-component system chemotaxis response regulator CheY
MTPRPVTDSPAGAAAAQELPSTLRILLVDDSRTMRRIQRNALAPLGPIEFVEAGDGAEAMVRLAAEGPGAFDLALVDWNMPHMDGLTLLRRARAADPTLPMIMVSHEGQRARVMEAIAAGVTDYVIKPFTPQRLIERVRLRARRSSAAAAAAAAAPP